MSKRLKLSLSLFSPPNGLKPAAGTYYPYFFLASPWLTKDSGIATVVPLNDDCPVPDNIHFQVVRGGPAAAMRAARDAVLLLPQNKGLKSMPADLDKFEGW